MCKMSCWQEHQKDVVKSNKRPNSRAPIHGGERGDELITRKRRNPHHLVCRGIIILTTTTTKSINSNLQTDRMLNWKRRTSKFIDPKPSSTEDTDTHTQKKKAKRGRKRERGSISSGSPAMIITAVGRYKPLFFSFLPVYSNHTPAYIINPFKYTPYNQPWFFSLLLLT